MFSDIIDYMQKDFDTWNVLKKRIHNEGKSRYYHERDIWWCSFGVNIGFEQDGKDKEFQRPVLVLKGLSQDTCFVVPLTTSPKKHRYRIALGLVEGKPASAIISQVRVIDTKRLVNKIAVLDKETFAEITKSARSLL